MTAERKLTLQSAADGGVARVEPFPFEVGRDSSNELWIGNDKEVSLLHARFTRDSAGDFFLHDLESGNGTFVNEERVPTGEPRKLAEGDEVRFGETRYTIGITSAPTEREEPAPAPAASTTHAPSPSATAPTPSSTAGAAAAGAAATPSAGKAKPPPPPAGGGTAAASSGKSKRNPILIALGALGLVLVGVLIASAVGGGDGERSNSDLVSEAKPSTVLVVSQIDGQRNGNGSGWVYDAEEGLIVTNAHVVDGSEQFEVGVDGDNQLRPATVVGVAPCDDLAVLKVDVTEGLRTMPLGSQADIEQGDKLLTIGYPGNGTTEDEIQVTDGVVSVVQTRADEAAIADPDFAVYPNVIQTDAAINAGNSGGPAISDEGKLIGVNTLASLQTQNQNFAIGVDRVKEVVPELAKGSSLGWAGFGFAAISEEDLAAEGLTGLGGGALVVTSVAPGTGAAREKVYVNDLVTTVNDKFVETRRQYCSAVRGVKSGDVVPIEVLDSVSNYETYYTLDVPFE